MFTGLIEEIGSVKSTASMGGGIRLTILAPHVCKGTRIGDSININGACQTVVDLNNDTFSVEAVEETLRKTTLGSFKSGTKVNLERALLPTTRLGGHFVLGHVDTVGKVVSVEELTNSTLIKISFDDSFSKYIIPVGSIAVDGISLTIAHADSNAFTISVIPHTYKNTTLAIKRIADEVNLEFDVLGKYILRSINPQQNSKITEEWLKEMGY